MTARTLDCWFEFGSPYSYLGVMRVGPLAARLGVAVRWRPFLLGPLFQSLGWESSPFVVQPQKGAYAWRDLERQAEKHGLPWRRPSRFPRSAVLPTRVALIGAEAPWCEAFAKEVLSLNFVADQDIDDPGTVHGVLRRLGLPAEAILAEALSPRHQGRLRAQIEEARQLGLFGAPTWRVGDELFWGDDRLEDALAWCLREAGR